MKLTFVFFMVLCCLNINAQTMYIRPNIGIQTSYIVSNIQKITFLNNNIIVNNTNTSIENFSLPSLRYINFTDLTLGTSTLIKQEEFFTFPNPVIDIMNISLSDITIRIKQIEIFSIEGRLLLLQNPTTRQIDLTFLPKGMYLCKIITAKKTYINKFLKQ